MAEEQKQPLDLAGVRDRLYEEFEDVTAIESCNLTMGGKFERARALGEVGSAIARVEGEIRERKLER